MDRGICVEKQSNASYLIKEVLFVFFIQQMLIKKLPLFAVSDRPYCKLDKY
jgi:hypothetical protein